MTVALEWQEVQKKCFHILKAACCSFPKVYKFFHSTSHSRFISYERIVQDFNPHTVMALTGVANPHGPS